MMRPESSHSTSRNAWDGIDNPTGPSPDYGGDMSAAMEHDMYDGSRNQPVVQVQESQSGCWFKFKRGIRCKYIYTSRYSVI